jgi:hypothetical protein
MGDTFSNLQSAAHSGAFGAGSKASPTPEQIRAGNYAKGTTRVHGMRITIETPMFQSRRGKQDGIPWSVLCMAHYGYINGTKGADGDAIDIFVGPMPESLSVFVVNQVNRDGAFDEHKVMLGFADEESARNAYMNSYEKGWTGLGSLTACSIKQFKYWLKHGDLSKPLQPGDLSNDEALSMSDVFVRWEGQQTPVGASLTEVIYDLRKHDQDGLLMDSATLADINEHLGEGEMLDAMVIELQKFDRKAGQLLKVMQVAAEGVKPTGVEVSKPFKNRGTTQVAMLFAMDDGQSVSVFFHNPDSTPNKLTPTDELVSWKWVLNKKDITITVAPEKGQDLNPREVARRIMKLVQKNSAKFIKANEGKADRDAKLEELKAAEASKTTELADLDAQVADLTAQLEAKKAAPAPGAAPVVDDESSVVLKGPAGPVTVAKTKYVDTGEWGVSWASTEVATAPNKEEGVAIAERVIASGAENIADMRAAAVEPAPAADSDAGYMAKSLASADTLKAQIVALGGTPYTAADFMAKVNAGEWQGFSLSELQSKLAEAQSDLAKVQSGKLTPRRVVGKGGTKKGAIAWLTGRIAAVQAALDADGFMYTVNVSNYTYHLRDQLKALQGASEPAPAAKPALSTGSTILEDYAGVAALGSATVLSVGSENVYFDKDGKQYMTKLLNTDDYESKVGEVVDLSGVVDPYTAPADKLSFTEWEGKVLEALAELMEVSTGDADGIAMGQAVLVKQLYRDSAAPAEAAQAIKTAATETPEQQRIERLLTMLTSAQTRLAGMQPGDAFYGNLVRDIADMASQLWDAGYRGPEASAQSVKEVPPVPEVLTGPNGEEFTILTEPTTLYRSVSPQEWEQIQKDGDIKGGLNAFNPWDKRREVFFGDALSDRLIGQGEDISRRADYFVQNGDLSERYSAVQRELSQVRIDTALRASELGFDTVEDVPRMVASRDPKLKELSARRTAANALETELQVEGRKQFHAKVDELRAEDEARGYSSVILETKPITGARIYQGKHSGMGVEAEYGFDSGVVKLADIVKIRLVKDKKVIDDAPAPESVSPSPAIEPGADEDQGEIAPEGRENTVKTAKGTKVATGFKIIEARNLVISHEADGTVNPDYPAEIQPRDRARTTSQAWVQKTARNLDPDSLGRTQRADSGAPIVGKDRVVESGNGRAMAIREAYRIGQADEYRDWLVENADYFGVDVAKIKRMKAPVLVRVRISDVSRVEFAVEANQDDKLAMTATEKARSDAKRLDAAMLAKLADGDLNSAANRDFVAAFLQSLGDAEAAQYLTTDGKPTSGLISRLQAALFAGAYSDDRLLELTADVAKPEIANIVAALNSAAPDFMRAKEQDRVGAETAGGQVVDSVELSLNQEAVNAIISATNVLRQAKESGMGLEEFLRQGDMFGGTDPAVAAMALFIQANNRSAKRMGTAFKAMAQFVESENTRKQTAGLFGDEPASFSDIVAAANRKLEQEYGEGLFAIDQGDMFAAPAQSAAPVPAPAPEPDEDDQLQKAKAYLDSLIEGSADLGAPAQVLERLESIYAQFGEGELKDLFEEASNAFRDYALKVTAGAF